MPRPIKSRRICGLPKCRTFSPHGAGEAQQLIKMELDEYETIRLIDLEGKTQAECAAQMGVARTTVQAIYQHARRKLAECIVHGARLEIAGGDVKCCEEAGGCPKRGGRGCRKSEHTCIKVKTKKSIMEEQK
ncbi:MAG: DUF134 domain-containing protein [Enterococcaceae bacterium]|nr:DUF134 domain-containing protein [Enterococcaceae bacterium]MCI1918660.1 DUF134 domain-containing protein [Enterococcaceae bacterium]